MSKEKKKKEIVINEYDEDPKEATAKRFKKKKRKRNAIIFSIIAVVFLIGLYFASDLSHIQTITIEGNFYISEDEILEAVDVDVTDYRILTSKKKIRNNVEAIEGIESVSVHNNIFQGLVVTVKESSVIGFCEDEGVCQVIYANGEIGVLENTDVLSVVYSYPRITGFGEDLEEFVEKYCQISSSVRSNFSDIVYENSAADPGKIILYSTDGKIIYIRLSDMVTQLKSYNNVMSEFPDGYIYDFVGDNVYIKSNDIESSEDETESETE